MSEMTARERIARIIEFGTDDENPWIDEPSETRADAILAIVREALLSEEAKQATYDAIDDAILNTFDSLYPTKWPGGVTSNDIIGAMRRELRAGEKDVHAAALDAAFGPAK